MSLKNESINGGIFAGKKFFFHNVKNNILKQKIIHILIRLDAIIEPFFKNEIDMVIIDNDKAYISGTKRKLDTPISYRAKKIRLMAGIVNNSISDGINDNFQSNMNEFLVKVEAMGCKVKTIRVLWDWLNQFYKPLVDNCYVDEGWVNDDRNDLYNGVKGLSIPAFKILDPIGGCRPILKEECSIYNALFVETLQIKDTDQSDSRKSNCFSRKSLRKYKIDEIGYCECCNKQYTQIIVHLRDHCHQNFANDEDNFSSINKITSDIKEVDSFFRKRLSLRQSHKFMKPNNPQTINTLQKDIIPVVDKASTKDILHTFTETNDSSSSHRSSCSSTSGSSGSSSDVEYEIINMNDLISSTPILKKKSLSPFSEDSLSNEGQYQSELSEHVNIIVNSLNVDDMSHITSSQYFDDPSKDLISQMNLNVSCEGLYPLNNNNNMSVVLAQRFRWCDNCGRNHVPINEGVCECPFSPVNTKELINKENELTYNSQHGMVTDNDNIQCIPTIEIVLKRLSIDEIESKTKARSIFEEDNTPPDNIEIFDVTQENDSRKVTDNDNIQCIPTIEIVLKRLSIDEKESKTKARSIFEEDNTTPDNIKIFDVTPDDDSRKFSENQSVILDMDDEEDKELSFKEMTQDDKENIPFVLETSFQSLNSSFRPKRNAAVAADKGIKNINRLMTASLSKTITCLQRSYSPMQYDPRIKMKNLKFSPEETKAQKRILCEKNE